MSVGFVKNKGKGVKICYWISVVVAYAFVLIPMIVDIANYAQQVKGNQIANNKKPSERTVFLWKKL